MTSANFNAALERAVSHAVRTETAAGGVLDPDAPMPLTAAPADPSIADRAIVAGAVGRLGEALLNAVLSRGGYREVVALAERPISLGFKGLSAQPIDQLPAARDLFIALGDDDIRSGRSFHGRDAPFVMINSINCLELVRTVRERGVSRVVLISPAPMWEQFGHIHRALGSPLERALGELGLHRLVVLRPLKAAGSVGGTLMQRFVHFYLNLQLVMTPRSVPTLTSEQIARAALAVLVPADDGVTVLSAGQIGQLLGAGSGGG